MMASSRMQNKSESQILIYLADTILRIRSGEFVFIEYHTLREFLSLAI